MARGVAGFAIVTALAVLAAGCGGSKSAAPATTGAVKSATASSLKVGLVTDIGGLNDRSFNHLAYVGLQRAQSKLGVQGRVLQSQSNADYIPNLTTLARGGYQLVVAVGFLMTDAVDTVAPRFPKTKFAIIDVPWEALKHHPKNVVGLVFRQEQGGYLAGYLAGLIEKLPSFPRTLKPQVVASVGGQKIPPVDGYIAGFQAGAKAADPNVKTLNSYSQDFVAQDKCKTIALNQIAQGADIVIQLAGGCGLGALDATKTKGVWGMGADADQGYLGPYILASALKKVDVSVYDTAKAVKDGTYRGGRDDVFDVKNGGIGIAFDSLKIPKSVIGKVKAIQKRIASGKIKNIPTTVR
jgi:basic membrane protein A